MKEFDSQRLLKKFKERETQEWSDLGNAKEPESLRAETEEQIHLVASLQDY